MRMTPWRRAASPRHYRKIYRRMDFEKRIVAIYTLFMIRWALA